MNRITTFTVADRALSPTEADVWILAGAETLTPTTELRGRLVGPTCVYSTTIEIAYPLRPIPQPPPDLPPLARRFVVPEPSMWDPVAPFLYHGTVELWQDGECCDRRTFRHGLRAARIDGGRVIWNGKPLKLSIVDRTDLSVGELAALRRSGANAIVVSGGDESLWTAAERLGFVVIGRAAEPRLEWQLPTRSPACLGWVVPAGARGRAWDVWRAQIRWLFRMVWDEEELVTLGEVRK